MFFEGHTETMFTVIFMRRVVSVHRENTGYSTTVRYLKSKYPKIATTPTNHRSLFMVCPPYCVKQKQHDYSHRAVAVNGGEASVATL